MEGAIAANQLDQPIGQLDLAAGAPLDAPEMAKYLRLQDVAADNAERRGRLCRRRLLDQAAYGGEAPVIGADIEDAIARRVLARYIHDGDDIAAGRGIDVDHLLEAGHLAEDEIVGEQDGEGLVADEIAGAPHGVTEAERLLLARVADLTGFRQPGVKRVELGLLPAAGERRFELEGMIEMILEGGLRAASDEDELLDPGGACLLDGMLDQRLVDHRQHLLRDRLGRRQKARPQPTNGKNGLAYGFSHQSCLSAVAPGQTRRARDRDLLKDEGACQSSFANS